MPDSVRKPRVAVLGAREEDMEILAELQRQDQVTLVAVYDPDPHAPGLSLAEIAGVPAGSDSAARERLATAEMIVLPSNRRAYRAAIDWCSGLRAELLGADAARERWGGAQSADAVAAGSLPTRELNTQLEAMEALCARVGSTAEMGEWLLDACMRAVGATGGSLQLLAADTQELYLIAARGLAEDVVRSSRHALGEPIAGLVAAMRTPQALHGPHPSRLPGQRGVVSAALCIPLVSRTEALVGVLNVSSTVSGRRFGSVEQETLQRAAPRLAALLEQARHYGAATSTAEADMLALLAALDAGNAELGAAMHQAAEQLRASFDADALALHLSTEAGDWRQMGAAMRAADTPAPPLGRALAARALLEQRWVHEAVSTTTAASGDSIADAVERALTPVDASEAVSSHVVAPLGGPTPVGVLVAVFSRLAAAERFWAHGRPAVRHLSVNLEARLRAHRLETRVARSQRLASLLPALIEASARGNFDATLLHEAAALVGAERALLRHVDEDRRTYSRPNTYGVPDATAEAWRRLDARITERTLKRRRLEVSTLQQDAGERLDRAPRQRSLVSVPIQQGERIVAILNVYDRSPRQAWEGTAFTDFDADLLQHLARMAGALWRRGAPGRTPASSPLPATSLAEPATNGTDLDSKRLRAELQREVARAERHQRPLTLAVLHIKGLDALAAADRAALAAHIDRVLRDFVRRSDLVGWYGPDRLLAVSPEADVRGRELESRIRQLVREKLPATTAVHVQLGTSGYPQDGTDVATLLQAAVSRLA